MIILLSPAKTFSKSNVECQTRPIFFKDAYLIVNKLKRFSVTTLQKQMNISNNLAKEAYDNYQLFGINGICAIYAYDGYAFKGFDVYNMTEQAQTYLSSHLYILSGLYGLVRPFDCITPYRLEIKDKSIKNLYAFWQPKITRYFTDQHPNELFINLASVEYSKVIDKKLNMITISFYQIIDQKYRTISMHAKLMRGKMANHLITHQVEDINQIKSILLDGYSYDASKSSKVEIAFSKELTL